MNIILLIIMQNNNFYNEINYVQNSMTQKIDMCDKLLLNSLSEQKKFVDMPTLYKEITDCDKKLKEQMMQRLNKY